jgi:predicted Zn-dependent protease
MIYFLLLCAGLLGGCATSTYNPGTEQQETLIFSTPTEIAMGESVAKRVEEEFTVIKDPELLARIDRISERLVPVADRKDLSYRFTIVELPEEDQPNAFALPGGPIYFTKSLMDLVESDDELASVMGHEMAHVVAKHSMKHLQASIGMQALQAAAIGAKTDSRTIRGLNLAMTSLFLEYSQADELEADRIGVKYMKAAGYDPAAGIRFMERLRNYTQKQPMRQHSYFRTHPFFADRIRLIRQQAEGKISFDDYINQKN